MPERVGPLNDRFLRACARQPVDATPVWFMRQAGRSLPEYRALRERVGFAGIVGDAALCAEVTLMPVRRLGVDAAILFADITTPLADMGVAVDIVDGTGPVITRPIHTLADVERLRPFRPGEAVAPLLAAIGHLRTELAVPLIGFVGAPFTLAAYLAEGHSARDAGALKRLMHRAPATAAALFERLVEMTVAYARAQVEAGVQALQVFDSWAVALGVFDYRRAVLPHMRRLLAALAPLGVPIIHFGTGAGGLLPLMAAAGGDVIGLDWRVSLADAWARVPGRAVQGNLDPAVLEGGWEAIEEGATGVLREAAGRVGHIFNLGHGVPPAAEPDDLRRLVDLVHERTAA